MMKVKIYTQAKSATQSGRGRAGDVVLEMDDLGARRPEPLMGWISAPDALNQVRLRFKTVEDAVAYAKKQGYDYSISLAGTQRVVPKNYTDKFKYIPPQSKE